MSEYDKVVHVIGFEIFQNSVNTSYKPRFLHLLVRLHTISTRHVPHWTFIYMPMHMSVDRRSIDQVQSHV
jgi:hypothetical protein